MEADETLQSDLISSKESVLQSDSAYSQPNELCYCSQQLSRIEGEQLKKPIHRSMVALTYLDANNKVNTGSGVLISKNIILTSASNIFNKKLNSENTDFKIYIGANGVAEEYHQVEGWRYPEEFKACVASVQLSHNYAIIKMKKNVKMSEYLPLSIACKKCFLKENTKIKLEVFGFPCAYPPDALGKVRLFQDNFKSLDQSEKRMKLYQYGSAQKARIIVVEINQSKIGYKISALSGQSGCPVILDNKIIAVQDNSQFNIGRIVDVSFMNNLWKWREDLNAAPFRLQNYYVCQHIKRKLEKMRNRLDFSTKKLKSVDLKEQVNLLELNLWNNQLRQIDLASCPRLTTLNLGWNQLQRIGLAKHKHLIWLYLNNNQLKEIDLRTNINLTVVSLQDNQLQDIDVRANINLTSLCLSSNQLQEIDVKANFNLIALYLHSNRITQINLTGNPKLEQLQLYEHRLTSVHLWIAENVQEERYTDFFSLSNQQSAVCRAPQVSKKQVNSKAMNQTTISLMCKGKEQAVISIQQQKDNLSSFDNEQLYCTAPLTRVVLSRREKTIRIVDQWIQKYSDNRFNQHNCAYFFQAC